MHHRGVVKLQVPLQVSCLETLGGLLKGGDVLLSRHSYQAGGIISVSIS